MKTKLTKQTKNTQIPYSHPGDNPFYSNIDSMPDIRPRRKSIPLVSELVSVSFHLFLYFYVVGSESSESDYILIFFLFCVMTI